MLPHAICQAAGVLHLALALQALALSVWFGGGLATLLATSAVFARAADRKLAGDLAGAILARTNVVRSLSLLSFAAAAALGARGAATLFGASCSLLQICALAIDVLTRRARRGLGGSVEALERGDPRRRRFFALHGTAMLVFVLQTVAAGAGLIVAS